MEQINEYRYKRAKERVEEIKSFYSNVLAYVVVISFLAWINYRTTDFLWFIFPAAGWGFGVLMHGLGTFGYLPFLGKGWEERKIKELIEQDQF